MTALSHARRVALFDLLEEAGPSGLQFSDLVRQSRMDVTTLRHHLRVMQAADLVIRQRKGVNIHFHLDGRAVKGEAEALAQRLARIPAAPLRTVAPPPLT